MNHSYTYSNQWCRPIRYVAERMQVPVTPLRRAAISKVPLAGINFLQNVSENFLRRVSRYFKHTYIYAASNDNLETFD